VESTTDEEFDLCLNVNLRGVFLACRAVLPIMKKQGRGVILNTVSSAGIIGRPSLPVYSAAKGGVVLLTKSLALAVGPYGIRVNCIAPGSIRTPMFEAEVNKLPNPEAACQNVASTCTLGRLGRAEDIAYAALFLASDEADFITGATLPVDGGRTAGVQEAQGVFDSLAGQK
jgi:3-oxoacyl-[acyl-carrier protein] reductase